MKWPHLLVSRFNVMRFNILFGFICRINAFLPGRPIKIFREKLPSSIPWQSAGVQYVIESSGMFTSLEKASVRHFKNKRYKKVAPQALLGCCFVLT